jgi:membrane-bound lytic murein transglycosylase B
MATLAGAFYKAERKHGFPKYLLVAVLAVESGYGKHYIKETNNPLGWGRGKVGFASIEEAINTVAYKVSMAPETEYLYRGFRATREVAQFCLEYNAPEAKEYCYELMQVINELKATEWEL